MRRLAGPVRGVHDCRNNPLLRSSSHAANQRCNDNRAHALHHPSGRMGKAHRAQPASMPARGHCVWRSVDLPLGVGVDGTVSCTARRGLGSRRRCAARCALERGADRRASHFAGDVVRGATRTTVAEPHLERHAARDQGARGANRFRQSKRATCSPASRTARLVRVRVVTQSRGNR